MGKTWRLFGTQANIVDISRQRRESNAYLLHSTSNLQRAINKTWVVATWIRNRSWPLYTNIRRHQQSLDNIFLSPFMFRVKLNMLEVNTDVARFWKDALFYRFLIRLVFVESVCMFSTATIICSLELHCSYLSFDRVSSGRPFSR